MFIVYDSTGAERIDAILPGITVHVLGVGSTRRVAWTNAERRLGVGAVGLTVGQTDDPDVCEGGMALRRGPYGTKFVAC